MTTKLASCPIVDGSGPVSRWLPVISLHIPIELVSICIEQNTGNKSCAYNVAPSIFFGERSLYILSSLIPHIIISWVDLRSEFAARETISQGEQICILLIC
jgi:hypothetical protein